MQAAKELIGSPMTRVDGAVKVTGKALYGADHSPANLCYAYAVMSKIASGRITAIDDRHVLAMPGIITVLTYKNIAGVLKPGKSFLKKGYMGSAFMPMGSDEIRFAGQMLALVIADSFENARAGAQALKIDYAPTTPSASFGSVGITEIKTKGLGESEITTGDFSKAYEAADVKIEARYETSPQHHNPMELFQTLCDWQGDKLTIHESTQNSRGLQHAVAEQLNIKPEQVHVISPFIGGAFGSRGSVVYSTALIAFIARKLARPVKFGVTRQQGFTVNTFRAETQHHIKIAADRDGSFKALSHESWELTSRTDGFALCGSDDTVRLYACPNIKTFVHNLEADRQTPGFMRAPPEMPYLFAMESAVDELSYALKLDPIELRRRNEILKDPVKNLPYTSRALMPCYDRGAKEFGWAKRKAEPRAIQEGEWLIGYGCATAFYGAKIAPCRCRITLTREGNALVEIGTHDIGNGTYTIVTQMVADGLGLPASKVEVKIGDSTLPAAPLTAGSNSTASICNVLAKACDGMRETLAKAASHEKSGLLHFVHADQWKLEREMLISPDGKTEPLFTAIFRAGKGQPLVIEESNNPHGAPPLVGPKLIDKGKPVIVGGIMKDRMQFAFGAHFVEARVHSMTGEIRIPRVLGAFAAGRIINPLTTRSQLFGGQIWGLASALQEATEIDPRSARYVNADLAEYHVAVSADVGEITTILLPEEDAKVNPLGIKGVGELGNTGVNAAVANAVYHATGIRIRKLPIRLDSMLTEKASA